MRPSVELQALSQQCPQILLALRRRRRSPLVDQVWTGHCSAAGWLALLLGSCKEVERLRTSVDWRSAGKCDP